MKRIVHQFGFSLLELAIVLFIMALVGTSLLTSGTAFLENSQRKTTNTKLAAIEAALGGYVAINGRLPCPADGSLPSSDANAGKENGGILGCTAAQINGVVPWVTLGMSENDISDDWNMRITYRVGNFLWVANGMDMTSCDPAGTDFVTTTPKLCTAGCSSTNLASCTSPSDFLQANKGLTIKDATVSGNTLMDSTTSPTGGAAYVLVSHGKIGGGGFRIGGGSVVGFTGAGADEITNANGVAITFPTTFFVDKGLNDATDATHFDDIVVRPSIMKVLQQAQRGPRAH